MHQSKLLTDVLPASGPGAVPPTYPAWMHSIRKLFAAGSIIQPQGPAARRPALAHFLDERGLVYAQDLGVFYQELLAPALEDFENAAAAYFGFAVFEESQGWHKGPLKDWITLPVWLDAIANQTDLPGRRSSDPTSHATMANYACSILSTWVFLASEHLVAMFLMHRRGLPELAARHIASKAISRGMYSSSDWLSYFVGEGLRRRREGFASGLSELVWPCFQYLQLLQAKALSSAADTFVASFYKPNYLSSRAGADGPSATNLLRIEFEFTLTEAAAEAALRAVRA